MSEGSPPGIQTIPPEAKGPSIHPNPDRFTTIQIPIGLVAVTCEAQDLHVVILVFAALVQRDDVISLEAVRPISKTATPCTAWISRPKPEPSRLGSAPSQSSVCVVVLG